ncbi:hypothetical protein E3J62_08930 [candidate division TA06 bacterium]|uniref:Uncharacterized protein n=1 Tax=candidate division TA06 bacterium TaxID=2250710 RepID=A0A523UR10_UNCT6|nr:MAG: hypothetical protein E3J62_08930 [candidate division TA06 bacterium]
MRWLKSAFGTGEEFQYVSPEEVPEERRQEIIRVLAKAIVERRLTAPAVFFLESMKPLSFVGSQAMIFLQPVIQAIFPFRSYNEFSVMMEDRKNVEELICEMERLEAEDREKRRREKRAKRRG